MENWAAQLRMQFYQASLENNYWFVPNLDKRYAEAVAKQSATREMRNLIRNLTDKAQELSNGN